MQVDNTALSNLAPQKPGINYREEESVSVLYFCVTHFHNLSGLKQYKFIVLQFPWVNSLGMDWLDFLLSFHKAEIKVLAIKVLAGAAF